MATGGNGRGASGADALSEALAARRRSSLVAGLRAKSRSPRSAPPAGPVPPPGTGPGDMGETAGADATAQLERCDLCQVGIPPEHRHLLHLSERRILCVCEPCWAMRSGHEDLRPTGQRTLWLDGIDLPEEVWANLRIPIGLAFFMVSSVTACVVAMYPSPAGATESELRFETWRAVTERNPVLDELEPDIEGLIVNRLSDPPMYVVAPIDRCYELTGVIKAHWEGISGGTGIERAVAGFFEDLRSQAVPA